jgi:polysaccharide export outer membrane protein
LFALAAGCNGPVYRAGSLPPEMLVAPKPESTGVNLANIAAPGGDQSRIDAGDLVEVTVASGRDGEESHPTATRVSDAGAAEVPLVGPVPIAGLEPFEAGQRIADASVERGIYRRPHVTLEIKAKAVNRVTVMGAVKKPGVYELPRASSDVVSALASAGGLTDAAGTELEIVRQAAAPGPLFDPAATPLAGAADPAAGMVRQAGYQSTAGEPALQRAGPQTVRVDLAKANSAAGDYRLGDRDMVMVVPQEKEVVFVTGLVNKPGQFDLPPKQDVRLLDAVAMAGGVSVPIADKVLVIRHMKGKVEPVPIGASLAGAKRNGRENIVLGAGDVVSIEQTPATAALDTFMKLFRFSVGMAGRTTVF